MSGQYLTGQCRAVGYSTGEGSAVLPLWLLLFRYILEGVGCCCVENFLHLVEERLREGLGCGVVADMGAKTMWPFGLV